jgi:hypothetical protein
MAGVDPNFESGPDLTGEPVLNRAFGIDPNPVATEQQEFQLSRALEAAVAAPLVLVARGVGYIARGCLILAPRNNRGALNPGALGTAVKQEFNRFDDTVLKHLKRSPK